MGGRFQARSYPIDSIVCCTTLKDLNSLKELYDRLDVVDLKLPKPNDNLSYPPTGYVTLFLEYFKSRVRLPLQSYFVHILGSLNLDLGQLIPNG